MVSAFLNEEVLTNNAKNHITVKITSQTPLRLCFQRTHFVCSRSSKQLLLQIIAGKKNMDIKRSVIAWCLCNLW